MDSSQNKSIDKNEAMTNYLLTCPYLKDYKIFFNFGVAEDTNKQFIANSVDAYTNKCFTDGSIGKIFSMTIIDFKSVGYNAIIKEDGYPDENIVEINEVQQLIDWINEQDIIKNFPDFGTDCDIESISTDKNTPTLMSVDTSVTPALAQYCVTINVEYIDTSKCIWNK